MVGSRVRDGGGRWYLYALLGSPDIFLTGKASETYTRCLDAVQNISRATLFAPVTRVEAVRAMSGFSPISYL